MPRNLWGFFWDQKKLCIWTVFMPCPMQLTYNGMKTFKATYQNPKDGVVYIH